MASRGCVNNPNVFCYICGKFVTQKQRQNITSFVKQAYHAYFGIKLGDQDKLWAPHTVCSICVEELRQWTKGKKKALPFGVPMVWREPKNHSDDCYFCSCKIQGYNKKNQKGIVYPNVPSAIKPVPHGIDVPIPTPPDNLDSADTSSEEKSSEEDDEFVPTSSGNEPQPFTQYELNDLVRDLGLPKDAAEMMGSRLKEKNLLHPDTTFSWYRNREQEFASYFKMDGSLVYCTDVSGIVQKLGIDYNAEEWRLFIDSSKRSLKGVLLNNGNKYASIPVAHSVHLKETYENLANVLVKINYSEHNWFICGDLKIITLLLGQQSGYTKFPCFLCEWDSRDRNLHWVQKEWPSRNTLNVGEKNVIRPSLVDRDKVLLPPLHIKLGLMKQFVKALSNDGACFKWLCQKFPSLSEAKLKEGIFTGPDIRKLISDTEFDNTMNDLERQAWVSFKEVVCKFLGNNKDPDYEEIVRNLLVHYKELGCNMSLKVHFLDSHLEYFPENLGEVSEEQGERFHQDMKEIERRYQGRWDVNMMADYCWMIKRDLPTNLYKRRTSKRSFGSKKLRSDKK